MEASGTPSPQAEPPPQAPAQEPARLSGGFRVLAVVLLLVVIVAGLFMGGFASEAGDSPNCGDVEAVAQEIEEEGFEDATCWESDTLKAISVVLSWASVAVLAVCAAFVLMTAIRGRRQPLAVRLVTLGVALGALAFVVAAID